VNNTVQRIARIIAYSSLAAIIVIAGFVLYLGSF
jgi:hypothetical protein